MTAPHSDPTEPRSTGGADTAPHEGPRDSAPRDSTRPTGGSTPPVAAEPVRPSGPSWPTVALGIVCIVVAGMALTYQLVDITVDWSIATPVAVVGAGALLVLLGLVGLLGGRSEDETR
jgi:hypothetical protein